MQLGRALNRGLVIGAQIGLVLALGTLVYGATLWTGGFTGMLFSGIAPLNLNHAAMATLEVVSGIAVGAAVGGGTFAAGHVATHTIPGLSYLLGDAPPRTPHQTPAIRPPARSPSATSRNRAAPQLDETDDRNTGFRRMIEEQRLIEEQRQNTR